MTKLSVRLDSIAGGCEQARFWSTLELSDEELIEALGGHRRAELRAAYAEWQPIQVRLDERPQALCRHHAAYPRALRDDALGPHSLELRGGVARLAGLLEEPVVAIVGTSRASDYGMEMARELARGLAASGITVASELTEGIPRAVHAGALEVGGATLVVMPGSLERCSPAWCAPLYRRILEHGSSIAESRASLRARHWWQYASARTLALLAQLVIVVEATDRSCELACANVARSRARHVAAVPGRVSSPASRGTNSLLMNGARFVREPQDALDLLFGVGIQEATSTEGPPELEPRLATVLARVNGGQDTVTKLAASAPLSGDVAVALAELELRGLLSRGDGGRYIPCGGTFV